MFKATALLLNYQKPDSLKKAIKSIREQSVPVEIIVFDNSGKPNPGFDCDLYISSSKNLHCKIRFLVGCYANSDTLFTLDDDVVLANSGVIAHFVDFFERFEHRDECVCGQEGYEPLGFSGGWRPMKFLKGRFMVFRRSYLRGVNLLYHDLIDPATGKSETGFGTKFTGSGWIGVDDLAFQLPAKYVFGCEIKAIADQPSAQSGLWRKPDHMKARQEFRNKSAVTRLSRTGGEKPGTVLLLTHDTPRGVLTPHLRWLQKNNPEVDVRVILSEDHPAGKTYNWKNGDQPLRKWWKEHGDSVSSGVVMVIEWDTLVTCSLPLLPADLDLAGKSVFHENFLHRGRWKKRKMKDPHWHSDFWYWWEEIPKLGLQSHERAAGMVSFGALVMRRWVLDAVCKPRWDDVYARSIQNELRFPSVAKAEGAKLGEICLPFVEFHEVPPGDFPAVYHGVKNEYRP